MEKYGKKIPKLTLWSLASLSAIGLKTFTHLCSYRYSVTNFVTCISKLTDNISVCIKVMPFSTVFPSNQDNERVIMKGKSDNKRLCAKSLIYG